METDYKEDLYQEYRIKLMDIEEKKEIYQRKKRNFDQEREDCREYFREENATLERLTEMWGECEDIGRLRCKVGDFVDEEQRKLDQMEEELSEEHRDICQQERAYEEQYQEACRKLAEEDETWQM